MVVVLVTLSATSQPASTASQAASARAICSAPVKTIAWPDSRPQPVAFLCKLSGESGLHRPPRRVNRGLVADFVDPFLKGYAAFGNRLEHQKAGVFGSVMMFESDIEGSG
jgi:hypothetical protein